MPVSAGTVTRGGVRIPVGGAALEGDLALPADVRGLIILRTTVGAAGPARATARSPKRCSTAASERCCWTNHSVWRCLQRREYDPQIIHHRVVDRSNSDVAVRGESELEAPPEWCAKWSAYRRSLWRLKPGTIDCGLLRRLRCSTVDRVNVRIDPAQRNERGGHNDNDDSDCRHSFLFEASTTPASC